jgi:hypothetical protein
MKIKDPKIIFLSLLVFLDIVLILFTGFNALSINKSKNMIDTYLNVDTKNKQHFTQLNEIQKGLVGKVNNNLSEFSDDYIFDSSIQAILIRELFRKIGIPGTDYRVLEELTSIKKTALGELGYLCLEYNIPDVTYDQLLLILQSVNKSEQYDFINELQVIKKERNNTLDIKFSYTNIGMFLEE